MNSCMQAVARMIEDTKVFDCFLFSIEQKLPFVLYFSLSSLVMVVWISVRFTISGDLLRLVLDTCLNCFRRTTLYSFT